MEQIKTKIEGESLIIDLCKTIHGTKKLAILLPGLPYEPKKYDLVNQLNNADFDVAFIHYKGTWGSEGEFLAKPPQKEIDALIAMIRDVGLNTILYTEISLLGTSFGGALALMITDVPIIRKIIVLSPVISYKKVPGINTLQGYLSSNFPTQYTFRAERFSDLISDRICSPVQGFGINPSKVMLMGGDKDTEIDIKEIENFGDQNKIHYLTFNVGHITFSKITNEILNKIIDYLK